jgi:hypothetical protein
MVGDKEKVELAGKELERKQAERKEAVNQFLLIKLEHGGNKMPGQDRTGPAGLGPLTGRGLGPCGGGMRRGFGRRGRCCPPKFIAGFTKAEEAKILEAELKQIDSEKQEIEQRLKELK